MENKMELRISALSKNEAFTRNVVAAFCVEANPTVDEIDDVKTVVSEAVTNCIVHAYDRKGGDIVVRAWLSGNVLHIEVEDFGKGIRDLDKALQAFYTEKPDEERSGMGFTIMRSFCDEFFVNNKPNGGVLVKMTKRFCDESKAVNEVGGIARSIESN